MGEGRLTLRDGRKLEYCVTGEASWDLLVLHLGTPCAVTEFPHVSNACAAHRIRTAIYSRPGYGNSTRQPGRAVANAAQDTAELADYLGAETFFVAGWSGGGPAALACSVLLPGRVRASITLASRAPPDEAGDDALTWSTPEAAEERQALLTIPPDELKAEYEAAARPFAEMSAERLIEWPENTESDVLAMRETPAAATSLARSMNLGVSGGIWGWLDDQLAWARPWGFLVGDVRVPLVVRHGTEDRIVPVHEARWLAGRVRDATLQELPGGGHSSVAVPFDPVIAALLAAGA